MGTIKFFHYLTLSIEHGEKIKSSLAPSFLKGGARED
jgi:hypothetical protein